MKKAEIVAGANMLLIMTLLDARIMDPNILGVPSYLRERRVGEATPTPRQREGSTKNSSQKEHRLNPRRPLRPPPILRSTTKLECVDDEKDGGHDNNGGEAEEGAEEPPIGL